MLYVYLHYPNFGVTVHGDETCPMIRRRSKPGQRLVAVTECSLERELARFETDYRFASRQKLDDIWVVLDLVNDLAKPAP